MQSDLEFADYYLLEIKEHSKFINFAKLYFTAESKLR